MFRHINLKTTSSYTAYLILQLKKIYSAIRPAKLKEKSGEERELNNFPTGSQAITE